jgi:hypothetical protein
MQQVPWTLPGAALRGFVVPCAAPGVFCLFVSFFFL